MCVARISTFLSIDPTYLYLELSGCDPNGELSDSGRYTFLPPTLSSNAARICMLAFRLTQVHTKHSCFGSTCIKSLGGKVTPACHKCGAPMDTARHTLKEWAAWRFCRASSTPCSQWEVLIHRGFLMRGGHGTKGNCRAAERVQRPCWHPRQRRRKCGASSS